MIESNSITKLTDSLSLDNGNPAIEEKGDTKIGELGKENIFKSGDYTSKASEDGLKLKSFHQVILTIKTVAEEKIRRIVATIFNIKTRIFGLIKLGSDYELEQKNDKKNLYFESLINKITNIFKKSKDIQLDVRDLKIHHLGGTNSASFDPLSSQVELDKSRYFYERVPVKVRIKDENGVEKTSQVFLYGNTLEKYAKEWVAETENGETQELFSDFAARRIADDSVALDKTSVRYFTKEDRRRTEITVTDGKLTQLGLDQPEDIKRELDGTYAFALGTVLDPETKTIKKMLFAAPKTQTNQGKIQHSSFFRGGNVLSAGMLEINSETSTLTIRNQSGHYKPTEKELAHVVKHLKDIGYDISKIHVNYTRFSFIYSIKNVFNINLSWFLVQSRADKWLEEKGLQLIERDLKKIEQFNQNLNVL